VIQRGAIWWATLPPPVGSGPGGRRPIVIVQADYANKSRIRTVIAVIITSNLSLARYLGNVFLPISDSGLQHDSVANVSQLLTIDRTLLTDYVATLPDFLIDQIDEGLRLILDLY
jgi:mRNA interferase MazF